MFEVPVDFHKRKNERIKKTHPVRCILNCLLMVSYEAQVIFSTSFGNVRFKKLIFKKKNRRRTQKSKQTIQVGMNNV